MARRTSRVPYPRRNPLGKTIREWVRKTVVSFTGYGSSTAPAPTAAATGAFTAAVLPAHPELHIFIDWDGDGTFDPGDEVTADLKAGTGVEWDRGRSADFSADATGQAIFTLNNIGATINSPGIYSPEVNTDLVPGKPILITSEYGIERAHFFGFIQRVTPDAQGFSVTVTCYDPLRRYQETDVVVPAHSLVQRSAHDLRVAVLGDIERGNRNLLANPSMETDIDGWTVANGTYTRIPGDAAPSVGGTACGEFTRSSGEATLSAVAYLAPIYFSGVVYRAAVYLRTVSGTLDAVLGLGYDAGITLTDYAEKAISLTTAWTRHTITFTPDETRRPANGNGALLLYIQLTSGGVIRVDAAQVTRGQALVAYADSGSGRWPNWCGNGSFDGGALNGWYDGFTNLVTNPSFETNTAGWTGITRSTTDAAFGSAHAVLTGGGAIARFALAGTFLAGVTYDFRVYYRDGTDVGGGIAQIRLGSTGTPTDKAEILGLTTLPAWTPAVASWTPSADRTDAEFVFTKGVQPGTTKMDGVMVTRRDSALAAGPNSYADTGPGGGGASVSSRSVSAIARYGSNSQAVVTPAVANSGRLYDFNHLGVRFVGGRAYSLSVWLRPSTAMPYEVGIGCNAGTGAYDEASTTGVAPANAWTQVTVAWTPSADRSSAGVLDATLYIYQTDASARTFLVDGVRVIPEAVADDFEMSHWVLSSESDRYLTTASLSGNGLSTLQDINRLALSRHFIRPKLTAPYYDYVVGSRDDLAEKAVAETFDNNFAGFTEADVDRDSIVNIVGVQFSGGTEYYSDGDSVGRYGPQPYPGTLGGAQFLPDRGIPDVIGPAIITRYKDPRSRPSWVRTADSESQYLSQLIRELDDLIQVTLGRLALVDKRFLIVKVKNKVTHSGVKWESTWGLEEHAF